MTQSSAPLRSRWFSRLSYPQKFIIISLIFILPLLAFGPLIYQQIVRIDQYGTAEYRGTLYLRPLQQLLENVQRHEQLLAFAISTNTNADVSSLNAQISDNFTELQSVDQKYGQEFNTGNRLTEIQQQWATLRDAATVAEAANHNQHIQLISGIRDLISAVGDASFLILDPDLDTYYVMDTVLLKMPEIQEYTANLTVNGSQAISSGELADPQQREQLIHDLALLTDRFEAVNAGLRYALEQNEIGNVTPRNASGEMRPLIEADLDAALQAYRAFQQELNTKLIDGRETATIDELNSLARASFDANARLYQSASTALEKGSLARQARYTNILVISLVIALAGVIFGTWLGLSVMRSISRPLSELVAAAKRLSTGDLTARAPVKSDDEVGQVAIAFNSFIDSLSNIVGRLVDSSAKLSSGTTQISAASNEMSAGAESQTQQAIRTSSAMEEIAATIKEVANNADATARATHAAATRARDGSGKVRAVLKQLADTNDSLQQLKARSAEIDQLVKLIADIAAQTNILSLNAAIEAAGAGAAGARFDVVAEEIRKLAQRTAESTARISGTVSRIQEEMQSVAQRTNTLAAQAEDVGQTLSDIVEGSTSVSDMIANISSSTSQQSRAVEQVAVSLQLITQVSQQTAQAAHETASTIDDLSGLAHEMSATAAQFKV